MNPIIQYVRAAAIRWKAFKCWTEGDVHIRGFAMKESMRDIVMAGVIYRLERRKQLR